MTNAGKECYSETYSKLVKRESDDPSEQADTSRKLLLLTCEESLKSLDDKSTSVLYEENIQKYTKLTSNGQIYEEKLCGTNNSLKWKSNLRNNKVLSQFLKTNIVKSTSLENEYKVLQGVFNTKSDYIPHSKPNVNSKYINPKSAIYSNPSTSKENVQIKTVVDSNFVSVRRPNFASLEDTNLNAENIKAQNIPINPVNPEYGNISRSNDVDEVIENKKNKFTYKKFPLNKKYNYDNNGEDNDDEVIENKKNKFTYKKFPPNKRYNYDDSGEDNDDKFKYKKNARSYSERFKAIRGVDDDDGEEDSRNPYFKKKKSMNMYKKRFNKCEDDEEEEAPKKCGVSAFKTASEEFNIQHMKKHGTSAPLFNSTKRKRLGMGGPSSKFVSPMINKNESGDDSSKSQESPEQNLDERLKNIDPKMVVLIKSEIMDFGPKIDWNDIAGLEFAKTAIQEAVVWPMLRPDIFTGLRRPPKGILLFGPPGTGKTLIGKCVASQSQSTFFSISASSLTSKWIGDGEKMVRALFAVARCHQPAVIFIDEIDSLLSQRSDSEHESSRRIKTEFLVQLDGATTDNEERLLLIGATNRPQELDEAARRRFVKRLYIPLPELKARLQLVQRLMSSEKHSLGENNIEEIAKLSDGYSGADMRNLCADACMGPIRSIDISQIQNIQAQEVRPVSMVDFTKSLSRVRPSVSNKDLGQYISWDKTYGSGTF